MSEKSRLAPQPPQSQVSEQRLLHEKRSLRPPGDQPGFEMLLPRFRDACDHMEPQNALDCAFCGEYPPDDPVLTSCLCLYCTECFTEVLAKAGKAGKSLPIACSAYGDDEVAYYMNLTFGQWEALVHVFDHHTEPLESRWKLYLPDDVNLLWQKCKSGNRTAHGDGEHSRNSPELGDDATELSSDNFDGESRSDGYEHDSGSDTESWLGLVSERGCVVDPRHNTSNFVVHHEEASNQLCLDEVTASEIAELSAENPAWEQDNDLSPADGSESPPHIDLTGADNVVTPVPVQDVRYDSSPDPGPLAHKVEDKNDHDHNGDDDEDDDEDGDDEESLCRCARCASVRESPSFFGS